MAQLADRIVAFVEKKAGKRFKQKDIARAMGVNSNEYVRFKRLLNSLERTGKIHKHPKSRYSSILNTRTLEGILSVTMKGFGFVVTGEELDVYVSADDMGGALGGDVVSVEITSRRQFGPNPEGKVTKIIERKRTQIVGTLKEQNGRFVLVPDERALKTNLPVSQGKEKNGKPGQKAVARLISDTESEVNVVEIIKIIGFPDEPGTDFESICATYNLSKTFPKKVMSESDSLSDGITKDEIKNRLDLRDLDCFTIDPIEAKDFDDAMSIELLDNGNFKIGIHIADVSHYVKEGTALDNEAFNRATSVYLIDHVIPMLPERISNDLCSLRPNEERYAFSVLLEITSKGEVKNYNITPSIIKSKHRFAYHEVQEILDEGKGKYFEELNRMNKIAKTLGKVRASNGSIDFDLSESKFRLDENGMPFDVYRAERLESHRLVEEFMLLANRTVSRHIAGERAAEKLPFLYRIHDKPKEEQVKNLFEMLKFVGVKVKISSPIKSEDFRDIMEIIEKLPEKDLLEKVALRSMAKAIYSDKNVGHFALAFKYYSHFTSPIRRYPDLIAHRLLKKYAKKSRGNNLRSDGVRLKKIAIQSSEREGIAVSAERDYARIKEVKFLSGKIGEEFDGIISGVIGAGLFIEIIEFPVEGFIPIKLITDDYYEYEKDRHRLIGRNNKQKYILGDKIRIRVKSVKIAEREVEFTPLNMRRKR